MLPNFFMEAKGSDSNGVDLHGQAIQDIAYGARSMFELCSYCYGNRNYDDNAYVLNHSLDGAHSLEVVE